MRTHAAFVIGGRVESMIPEIIPRRPIGMSKCELSFDLTFGRLQPIGG